MKLQYNDQTVITPRWCVVHSQRLRSATRLVHFAPLASSMNIAAIEDAKGAKWTKRVADLSLWE